MLTIGTTAGGGTSTFTTNRPIAVDGEVATINLNGYLTTLTGPIASLGALNTGLGNATGESDLTIDDTSVGSKGVLTLSGILKSSSWRKAIHQGGPLLRGQTTE